MRGRLRLATPAPPDPWALGVGALHPQYVMGGNSFWRFGASAETDSAHEWGDKRLLSNLKAWMTLIQPETSLYQGWHDWHTDGPATYGRFHKAFLMVHKPSGAPNRREQTNVRLVPADAMRAHADCFEAFAHDEEGVNAHLFNTSWPRRNRHGDGGGDDTQRSASQLMRAWGVPGLWHGFERLGCDIPLEPGDLLFFREDIWHRTQDMNLDRLGLILDVIRYPLEDVPLHGGSSSPSRVPSRLPSRLPQPKLVDLLARLPRARLRTAIEQHDPSATCAQPDRASVLPQRGFAVVRNALSERTVQSALAVLAARPAIAKVEAAGRVYSEQLGRDELIERLPSVAAELEAVLQDWDASQWLPQSMEGAGGKAARVHVQGAQFVSIRPEWARADGCPACRTAECQAQQCPQNVDWHVDGDGLRMQRIHKFWVLLSKQEDSTLEAPGLSNIVIAPSTGREQP